MRYRVHNATRNTLLASEARRATSFLARLQGLMGVADFPVGQGLLIEPCTSIHTFFMKLPIDALFLSPSLEVVGLYHALAPWGMSRLHLDAAQVLELPAGVALGSGTEVGDHLAIDICGPAATLPTP